MTEFSSGDVVFQLFMMLLLILTVVTIAMVIKSLLGRKSQLNRIEEKLEELERKTGND
ncbi:DUF4083 domain-containing protein [Jeotgalibacillus sp. R-1-5s-1]|uniref:DUF4083 domain-containing protein n=1 Tax=Jeotgalibacillus sp. R-1-5s-1 TaxID=2555897 RepID=UPI00106D03EC|nr:DUF4083 domain-containing protein [Jeotgalibacillus sp. R-1-5s-1]TFD99900.1 DUF4083 domain-containing protein [Jeotgalibacillus sp. R-1-5s-1]